LTDDPTFSAPIVGDGGSTLNASSEVHEGDLINGSITLAALDSSIDPISGLPFGSETVAWAGVEIGESGTSTIPATAARANFDSLDIPEANVPEGGSGSLYLLLAGAACFAALALSRRLGSSSAPGN
jgi:hypothetical protein